jgi:DNA-binding LytR/AlgR family response regulator
MSREPVRILVAEDEQAQRSELIRLLERRWPGAELVAECADGDAAMRALEADHPDVLFLDIRMPGRSGLEVARAASGRAHVVLITAYEEYAVKAFEAGALDYLLKPVTEQRLDAALERLQERLAQSPPRIDELLAELDRRLGRGDGERLNWISATCGDAVRLIAVDEVLFFRACEKYVRVVTAEDEALVRTPLKELAERLDAERFWHIHRSVIVAVAAVHRIERDELGRWRARLRGHDERLPVSESARNRFRGM